MKNIRFILLLLATLIPAWAQDIDAIQGKWSVKKTGDRGPYTQQIEFRKNKFFFKILGDAGQAVFAAEGEIELKKQGPFNTVRFFKIQAGSSETALEAVEEERTAIYLLDNGQLYLASNFDRLREREKPSADAYSKVN